MDCITKIKSHLPVQLWSCKPSNTYMLDLNKSNSASNNHSPVTLLKKKEVKKRLLVFPAVDISTHPPWVYSRYFLCIGGSCSALEGISLDPFSPLGGG